MNARSVTFNLFSRAWLKSVSVLLMSLLLFLTVMNYFVYSDIKDCAGIENLLAGTDDNSTGIPGGNPAGPDEKSPDAPVSVNEEYIHKYTELSDPFWINCYVKYIVEGSEKLHVTHFEIVSPPPDVMI